MIESSFFDILIYRCSIDDHTEEMEKEKQRYLRPMFEMHGPGIIKSHSYNWMQNNFDKGKWYPWRYNEVIGWVHLFILGTQVRGELWFIKSKRIAKNLKGKKIFYIGEVFELRCHPAMKSSEIFEKLCSRIEYLKRQAPIKGRYLDTEGFRQIGAFVDWRKLIDFDK